MTGKNLIQPPKNAIKTLTPGLLLCLGGGFLAWGVSRVLPGVSPLLLAILGGIVAGNLLRLPDTCAGGIGFSAKKLLRLGIILLGLQISLREIADLGWQPVLIAVLAVACGFVTALLLGKKLGVSLGQRLLLAAGFSICGAAAVAAVEGVLGNAKKAQETALALALVVVCGTAMIGIIPAVAALIGIEGAALGVWAGAAAHEVAQVVAIGGVYGTAVLAVAVLVKLTRVLLLAPIMLIVSWQLRRASAAVNSVRPPLMPLFVVLFLCCVLLNSLLVLPAGLVATVTGVQTFLLTTAMFALGLGVRAQALRAFTAAPAIIAVTVTLVITLVTLGAVLILL